MGNFALRSSFSSLANIYRSSNQSQHHWKKSHFFTDLYEKFETQMGHEQRISLRWHPHRLYIKKPSRLLGRYKSFTYFFTVWLALKLTDSSSFYQLICSLSRKYPKLTRINWHLQKLFWPQKYLLTITTAEKFLWTDEHAWQIGNHCDRRVCCQFLHQRKSSSKHFCF